MSKLLIGLTALMLVATMFVPVISKASHLAAGGYLLPTQVPQIRFDNASSIQRLCGYHHVFV